MRRAGEASLVLIFAMIGEVAATMDVFRNDIVLSPDLIPSRAHLLI